MRGGLVCDRAGPPPPAPPEPFFFLDFFFFFFFLEGPGEFDRAPVSSRAPCHTWRIITGFSGGGGALFVVVSRIVLDIVTVGRLLFRISILH